MRIEPLFEKHGRRSPLQERLSVKKHLAVTGHFLDCVFELGKQQFSEMKSHSFSLEFFVVDRVEMLLGDRSIC